MKFTHNGSEIYERFGKIVIYGNGQILFTADSGYFEPKDIKNNEAGEAKITTDYNNPYDYIEAVELAKEPKRANKENLNRKDNYILKYEDYHTIKKALYIHESEISVEYIGEILAFQTEEEKDYLNTFKLTFHNPVIFRIKNNEKIYADNFELPENGIFSECYGREEAPCYYPFDENDYILRKPEKPRKGVIKRWFTYETLTEKAIIATERGYCKTIESEERKENRKIAEMLNKVLPGNNFSHFDIKRIKDNYNLILTEK